MSDSIAGCSFTSRNIALPLLLAAGCAALMAQDPAAARTGQFKHGVDFIPNSTAPRQASAPAGAHLTYYGGRIVAHPVIYNVLWATSSVQTYGSDIEAFLRDVGTLNATMLREYSTAGLAGVTSNQTIGLGTFGGTYTVTPASSATAVSDATIQTQLKAWIAAGRIPAPQHDPDGSNNTIYNIMFPHGTTITQGGSSSCVGGGFCAYHGTVGNVSGYGEVYYIVMPDQQAGSGCDTGCGLGTNEQNYTSVLSHEVAETITDGEVSIAGSLGPPLAWYDKTNGEISDICNAQQATVTGPSGRVWTMQKFFSNSQNNCILIVPGTQTITFNTPADRTLGSGPVALSATATSGLTVTFTGGLANVCSVTSGGSVTLIGVGTCPVTANQAGGIVGAIQYSTAAPVTRTFLITSTGATPQTITFSPTIPDKTLGAAPFTISATASPSGLPVSFASLTTPTCTVSGTTVTLVAVGQCSIQATQPGNATYAPAPPVTNKFQISAAAGGLVNGGFESGNLSGWTPTGTAQVLTGGHTGVYAARLGNTTATNGDSTIAQTFNAPAGTNTLTFWYKMTCPDTVSYDWATATLKDNTANTTATLLAKICTTNAWTQVSSAALTAGHSYTVTLVSHDDNYAADPTYALYDDVALVASLPPPPAGIINGTFETGNLTGWTPAGTTSVVAHPHSGINAAQLGATTATNGDSTIVQTFTASTGITQLSLYYSVHCPDTVAYDWATVTLKDNTAGTTATVVAKTCTNTGVWVNATSAVVAGHNYTLTLVSHDDNYGADPTYTWYDDVILK